MSYDTLTTNSYVLFKATSIACSFVFVYVCFKEVLVVILR